MTSITDKAHFLQHSYTTLLSSLPEDAPRLWGKMNVRQMIEHMADYVRIASGRSPMQVVTPEDQLPRMQAFLASDKNFRENTPNSLMADEPPSPRHPNKEAAIYELQQELDYFFQTFTHNPALVIANPFFGHLNYDLQVQLLYKHSTHHLRQFGIADS